MGSKYWDEWYKLNASTLNERRRKRYASDPEYREAVRRQNKKSQRKRKKGAELERLEEASAIKVRSSASYWKTVPIKVNGVKVSMFTVGAVARVLGRNISTVRNWESSGVLPVTSHRSPKGERLYTVEMVEQICEELERTGKLIPHKQRAYKKPKCIIRTVEYTSGKREKVQLYQIGTLGRIVNRSVVSLLTMEKKKRLPPTPLRVSSIGIRLYTLPMIEAVKDAFNTFNYDVRGAVEWGKFYDLIDLTWIKQGIARRTRNAPDARIVEEDENGKTENKSYKSGRG